MAWDYEINIKQYLNQYDGDDDEVDIVTVAENVAKELKTVPIYVFGDLPDKLVSKTKEAVDLVESGHVDSDYAEFQFNKVLEQIYDTADDYRVWLGL